MNIVGGNLHSLPGHSEGSRPKQHLLVNHLPDNLNVALQMSNWACGIRYTKIEVKHVGFKR